MTEPNQATSLKDIVRRVSRGMSTGLEYQRTPYPYDEEEEQKTDESFDDTGFDVDSFIPEDYDKFDMMQEKLEFDEKLNRVQRAAKKSASRKKSPSPPASSVSSEPQPQKE